MRRISNGTVRKSAITTGRADMAEREQILRGYAQQVLDYCMSRERTPFGQEDRDEQEAALALGLLLYLKHGRVVADIENAIASYTLTYFRNNDITLPAAELNAVRAMAQGLDVPPEGWSEAPQPTDRQVVQNYCAEITLQLRAILRERESSGGIANQHKRRASRSKRSFS